MTTSRRISGWILLSLVVCCCCHQDTVMRLLATWFVTCTKKPGRLYCSSDCQAVVVCTGNEDVQVAVEKCDESTACDSNTLMCEPVEKAVCKAQPAGRFRCNTPGIFPDIHDCRVYHNCTRLSRPRRRFRRQTAACDPGQLFDLQTTECVPHEDTLTCPQRQMPDCKQPGQMEPLLQNRNFYYICVIEAETRELVHWLFTCPPSQVFEGNRCMDAKSVVNT